MRVPLAAGDLRDVLPLSEVVSQGIHERFLSQKRLPPHIGPDRGLADAPGYELPVFLLCLASLGAELPQHPGCGQAGMRFGPARRCQIAGPPIRLRPLDHLCTDGVQYDIAADLKEMTVLLDQDRLVPALKEVPGPSVALVEQLGIDAVHLPHADGEITIRGLDEEVKMVGHQAVGVADPGIALVDVLEGVQEVLSVGVILEDRLLLVAAGGHMIDSAGIFDAEGTSHG